jgi:hypothetical protein
MWYSTTRATNYLGSKKSVAPQENRLKCVLSNLAGLAFRKPGLGIH